MDPPHLNCTPSDVLQPIAAMCGNWKRNLNINRKLSLADKVFTSPGFAWTPPMTRPVPSLHLYFFFVTKQWRRLGSWSEHLYDVILSNGTKSRNSLHSENILIDFMLESTVLIITAITYPLSFGSSVKARINASDYHQYQNKFSFHRSYVEKWHFQETIVVLMILFIMIRIAFIYVLFVLRLNSLAISIYGESQAAYSVCLNYHRMWNLTVLSVRNFVTCWKTLEKAMKHNDFFSFNCWWKKC